MSGHDLDGRPCSVANWQKDERAIQPNRARGARQVAHASHPWTPKCADLRGMRVLRDRKRIVGRLAANRRLRSQLVREYGDFLRTLFGIGDWFVTITFRDRHQDSEPE